MNDMRPSYKHFRVWGSLVKPVIPTQKKTKIHPKIMDCKCIGYTYNNNAYKLLVYG